ncbi:hypothetical protein WN55_07473 [Dufourea novaeangliae]|uniref:Uncharacterized protein n=1 Tax=Dufourea novaeangliae TaxID=178035 RepID=A0A154PTG7_DUFNO|nr:hypothetical protein WN55_07473 [Dufourea novaeangliae]
MIHEWPEGRSNPVGQSRSYRRATRRDPRVDRFINAYWKQVGR